MRPDFSLILVWARCRCSPWDFDWEFRFGKNQCSSFWVWWPYRWVIRLRSVLMGKCLSWWSQNAQARTLRHCWRCMDLRRKLIFWAVQDCGVWCTQKLWWSWQSDWRIGIGKAAPLPVCKDICLRIANLHRCAYLCCGCWLTLSLSTTTFHWRRLSCACWSNWETIWSPLRLERYWPNNLILKTRHRDCSTPPLSPSAPFIWIIRNYAQTYHNRLAIYAHKL